MTKAQPMQVTTPNDLEIEMTRDFSAPRHLLFRAYTDPTLIPKWWGLRNHTTTVDKMDVRPGGGWRYVCRDQDGNVFAFRGEYREVVPPSKLVYTFEFEPMAGHVMTETILFEEKGRTTRVTTRSAFTSKEDRDGMIASGMEQGATESCERLDELLATLS
ncbi:MAG TPA: SRPBCC family protein [Phycisphaerae bacterium]|nr:SRPBCC family protein [Phycisphaerae bacterium]